MQIVSSHLGPLLSWLLMKGVNNPRFCDLMSSRKPRNKTALLWLKIMLQIIDICCFCINCRRLDHTKIFNGDCDGKYFHLFPSVFVSEHFIGVSQFSSQFFTEQAIILVRRLPVDIRSPLISYLFTGKSSMLRPKKINVFSYL